MGSIILPNGQKYQEDPQPPAHPNDMSFTFNVETVRLLKAIGERVGCRTFNDVFVWLLQVGDSVSAAVSEGKPITIVPRDYEDPEQAAAPDCDCPEEGH